jgi:hypothetical protein
MSALRILIGVLAAATITQIAVVRANAQENIDGYACQYIGTSTLEPLGDREGHGLRVVNYTCLVTAGPLSGGVYTGESIWETDKSGGTFLAGEGVIRKPGATTVCQLTDGKLEVMMSDGKVVGVTSSGHGHYVMAVGSAASLSGKTFTYATKTTGPGQFSIEATRE